MVELGRGGRLCRVDHRSHAVLGHQTRQVGGGTERAPVDLGQPEGGVVRRDHDVGVAGDPDTAAETETVDGSDDRDLAVVDGGEGGGAAPVDPDQGLVPFGLDLLDVDSGAEPAPFGPHDDRPHLRVTTGGQDGLGQLEPAGDVEGVDGWHVDDDLGGPRRSLECPDAHLRLGFSGGLWPW